MTNLKEIYKCEICGNIVEVLHTGQGELFCCGGPMNLESEKKEDVGLEKHVPILEKKDSKMIVKVGEIPHPMEEEHFIEWVEVIFQSGRDCKFFLKPGDKPQVEILTDEKIAKVREYCNIHGLWVNT